MAEDATDSPPRGSEQLLAAAPAMRDAIELARRAARVHSTVLVTGETGTGKERIASFIHARSPRSERPFVKVNCAALPETLIESELFGHERGAFTGADHRRVGRDPRRRSEGKPEGRSPGLARQDQGRRVLITGPSRCRVRG